MPRKETPETRDNAESERSANERRARERGIDPDARPERDARSSEDETDRGYDEAAHRGNAYGIPEGLGGAFGTSGGGTYAGGFQVEHRLGHAGRGPRGYQRTDERILDDAHDRLERDGWVDATDVEVSINAGEISLRGTVETREMRRRAEDIVDSISGVRHVTNDLRVRRR